MSLQHTSSSISPISLNDNDWPNLLENNLEAQTLLANAIAHHETYREDEVIKRKGHLHHKTDPNPYSSRSDSRNNDDFGAFSDGENSSDDGGTPIEGKPAPKKAGRKPLTTEPTNKRKAQNRAAQRAFRERKEKYVKSLEDRIKELEENSSGKTNSQLQEENMNLKVLVQKLETENYFLKEKSFTFDFPISQPGLYQIKNSSTSFSDLNNSSSDINAAINNISKTQTANISTLSSLKDTVPNFTTPSPTSSSPLSTYNNVNENQDTSASSPSHSINSVNKGNATITTKSTRSLSGNDQLPWTPPTGVDSVPNSPDQNLASLEQDTISDSVPFTDNAAIVPRFKSGKTDEVSLFSILGDKNSSFLNSGLLNNTNQLSNFTPISDNTASPSVTDIMNTPLFDTDSEGLTHFAAPLTTFGIPAISFAETNPLFTEFRDPAGSADFFAAFDDSIDPNTFDHDPIEGLFDNQILNFNTNPFGAITSTTLDLPEELPTEYKGTLEPASLPLVDKNTEKSMPCPEVWEQISKHPKFDEVDIDELCAELKAKAKCTGHGPMITVNDINALMNKLDQH